jgi:predicted nucleotidyltransferase
LYRSNDVARLEVFGSLARGEPHRDSDIDLLVTFHLDVHLGWDFFELTRRSKASSGARSIF